MIVATELQKGSIGQMVEDGGLDDRVYEVAAACSITRRADGLDLKDFDEAFGERPNEG
jgi:hypothetical protein